MVYAWGALYLLSFGPFLGWYGGGISTIWGCLPPPVRLVYGPTSELLHLFPDAVADWYVGSYLDGCMLTADRLRALWPH